jgi:hypothetical protein
MDALLHLCFLTAPTTAYSADQVLLDPAYSCAKPNLYFLEKVKFVNNKTDFFLHADPFSAMLKLPNEHGDLRV